MVKRAMACADGGHQEPGGSPLAEHNGSQEPGGGQEMPERLTIGTKKAFKEDYAFPYQKKQVESETIYVCRKGSDCARASEVLVLRCSTTHDKSPGTWTAYDSDVSADGSTLQCRQPVFRCFKTDITVPAWHEWEINYAASPSDAGFSVDWQGTLLAETRVP